MEALFEINMYECIYFMYLLMYLSFYKNIGSLAGSLVCGLDAFSPCHGFKSYTGNFRNVHQYLNG